MSAVRPGYWKYVRKYWQNLENTNHVFKRVLGDRAQASFKYAVTEGWTPIAIPNQASMDAPWCTVFLSFVRGYGEEGIRNRSDRLDSMNSHSRYAS